MRPKFSKKLAPAQQTPLENKQFFIGIALGDNPTTETGIAVLNRNLDLMRIDKLFTNYEIESYIRNFSGTRDAVICVSLAPDSLQLSSKWRQDEKNIHAFKLYDSTEDMLWTDRFSERGKDMYEQFNEAGITVFRYNIYLAKMRLNLIPPFKKRSQPGCRYLQTVIKDFLSVNNLPSNLVPITVLDAIVGAYTGWKMATDKENNGYVFVEPFKGQKVVLPLKPNPRTVPEPEIKSESKSKSKSKKK